MFHGGAGRINHELRAGVAGSSGQREAVDVDELAERGEQQGDGDQLGQGMENSRRFLRDNPELAAELERLIKEKLGVGVKAPAETEAEPKLKAVDGF